MKILTKHYDFIPHIYLPIFIIALILLFFFPQHVIACFQIHWLVLLLLGILAISPAGKIRLGEKTKPIKFLTWLLLIFLAEIGVIFIYWGFAFIATQALPINIPASLNPNIISTISKTMLLQWGFFPWPIFTLLGIALAYVGFVKGQRGMLSITIAPLLKNTYEDSTGLTLDFFASSAAFFSIASSIGMLTLLMITLLSKTLGFPLITGLHIASMVIATFLLFSTGSSSWTIVIRYLSTKNFPLVVIAALFIITLTLFTLIFNLLAYTLIAKYPAFNTVVSAFNFGDWASSWTMFTGMWLLGWAPLIGGLIAMLSRGYQIRTVIGGAFILLAATTLVTLTLTHTHLIANSNLQIINYALPLLGFIIIAILFMRANYLNYQKRGVVPGTHPEKPRPLHTYKQALLQSSAFMVIFYLPIGIFLWNWLTFLMVFPLAIALFIMSVAFIKRK